MQMCMSHTLISYKRNSNLINHPHTIGPLLALPLNAERLNTSVNKASIFPNSNP